MQGINPGTVTGPLLPGEFLMIHTVTDFWDSDKGLRLSCESKSLSLALARFARLALARAYDSMMTPQRLGHCHCASLAVATVTQAVSLRLPPVRPRPQESLTWTLRGPCQESVAGCRAAAAATVTALGDGSGGHSYSDSLPQCQ
jgi:hypothetical protein